MVMFSINQQIHYALARVYVFLQCPSFFIVDDNTTKASNTRYIKKLLTCLDEMQEQDNVMIIEICMLPYEYILCSYHFNVVPTLYGYSLLHNSLIPFFIPLARHTNKYFFCWFWYLLLPVTGRSQVRVTVSSHCTAEGKACHWHPSSDPAQSRSSLH